MAEIKEFDLGKQRQEEAFGFHQLACAETAKCTDAKVTDLQTAYADAFAAFDKALKTGGANIISDQLLELDTQRDNAYSGLAAQTRTSLRHFDPEKVATAREADLILRKYGNPNALPYVQQNGVVHNLIQDLEAFDAGNAPSQGGGEEGGGDDILRSAPAANRLATIGAREWLDQLKSVNDQFLAAFATRNAAQGKVVTGETKAARQAVDAAYRAVVKRINALAEVNGEADYISVINAVNALVDRQKAVLAARKTTNANAQKKKEEAGGDDILK